MSASAPIVLLQHGGLDDLSGKTGLAMLRYRSGPIVAVMILSLLQTDITLVGVNPNLATVLRTAGQPNLAFAHMEEALRLTDETGNPGNHAYLLNILGKIYRDLGDDERALEVCERAREICVEHRLHLGLCFHLSAVANIHWERGSTEACLDLYEEMARVSRNINQCLCYLYIAIVIYTCFSND